MFLWGRGSLFGTCSWVVFRWLTWRTVHQGLNCAQICCIDDVGHQESCVAFHLHFCLGICTGIPAAKITLHVQVHCKFVKLSNLVEVLIWEIKMQNLIDFIDLTHLCLGLVIIYMYMYMCMHVHWISKFWNHASIIHTLKGTPCLFMVIPHLAKNSSRCPLSIFSPKSLRTEQKSCAVTTPVLFSSFCWKASLMPLNPSRNLFFSQRSISNERCLSVSFFRPEVSVAVKQNTMCLKWPTYT